MQLIHCPACGNIADSLESGNAKCMDCKGVREICAEMPKPDWHMLVNVVIAYSDKGSDAFVDKDGNVFILIAPDDITPHWNYTSAGCKTSHSDIQISEQDIPF